MERSIGIISEEGRNLSCFQANKEEKDRPRESLLLVVDARIGASHFLSFFRFARRPLKKLGRRQKSVTLVRDIRIVGVRVVMSSFKHFGPICLTSSVHTGKKKKIERWGVSETHFKDNSHHPCLVLLIYSPFSLLLLSHRPWEQLLFQSCIVRVYIDGRPARPC